MPSYNQTQKSQQKDAVSEWEARDNAMWENIRGLDLNDQTYLINAEGNKVMVKTGGPEDIQLRKMGYTGVGSIGKSYGGQVHFPGRSYASEGADTYVDIEGNTKPTPKNIDTVTVTPSFSGGQGTTSVTAPITDRQVVELPTPRVVEPLPFKAPETFIPSGIKLAPEKESTGNQYGYHQRPGQNFLTVNNNDPYWDTHKMGTGTAWSDAKLKNQPKKEVDTQAIKNWLSSLFN